MHNIQLIEDCYRKFIEKINDWIPDGINIVNLDLLHYYDLLHFLPYAHGNAQLTSYFQMIESVEKITLINDEFVIWIIPDREKNVSMTYVLIALNRENQPPHLEAAFVASGVYNSSKLVLKLIEKFLIDIHENECLLLKYNKD